MTIPFESLIVAKSAAQQLAEEQQQAPPPNRHSLHKIRKAAKARLIAQEYVRNGMNLRAAVETITGKRAKASQSIYTQLGDSADVFVQELSRIVDKSDVSRDRALAVLWGMVNTSILDFMDDHGHVLPISELRKLPRIMQVMLNKISISSSQQPAKGPDGKVLYDDNGSPYLVTTQKVRIEIPEKMAALNQLAQIMKWIGPTLQMNTVVNIGLLMSDAEARVQRAERMYDEAKVIEQK